MTREVEHAKKRRFKINYAQTIVYICLVLIVAFSFWLDGRNQRKDEVARCVAGVDTRNVQRQLVEAIYNLATGSIVRGANDPPYTNEQIVQINSYIVRVNQFRADIYKKIAPSDLCAPYVEDDNVRPPTPPMAPLKKQKETE